MTGRRRKAGRIQRRRRLERVIYFLSLILLLEAALLVYRCYKKDKEKEDRFRQLELIEDRRGGDPKEKGKDKGAKSSLSDARELDNKDWIGWVEIPDTGFSYPVMQKKGDGQYYLYRDFDGNYSFYGTPFLDSRCSPGSDNLIIYGHNINGGRLFGALHAYGAEDYGRSHPQVDLRLRDRAYSFQVMSVIQTDIGSPAYSFTDTGNWDDYKSYVSKLLLGAAYRTKMAETIQKEMEGLPVRDFFKKYQFLTLSTCRSWLGRDKRLLVVAARER